MEYIVSEFEKEETKLDLENQRYEFICESTHRKYPPINAKSIFNENSQKGQSFIIQFWDTEAGKLYFQERIKRASYSILKNAWKKYENIFLEESIEDISPSEYQEYETEEWEFDEKEAEIFLKLLEKPSQRIEYTELKNVNPLDDIITIEIDLDEEE